MKVGADVAKQEDAESLLNEIAVSKSRSNASVHNEAGKHRRGFLLVHYQRCEGDQYPIVALIALTRFCVSNASFSASILLCVGTLKWKTRCALEAIVWHELVHDRGGEVSADVLIHNLFVLDKTVMRHLKDVELPDDSDIARTRDALIALSEGILSVLTCPRVSPRLGNRCRWLPGHGRWRCANRDYLQ